ncbi:MAG: hypothetical protein Q9174_007491, partial [Haloplaca sp. 1 TL-2023]
IDDHIASMEAMNKTNKDRFNTMIARFEALDKKIDASNTTKGKEPENPTGNTLTNRMVHTIESEDLSLPSPRGFGPPPTLEPPASTSWIQQPIKSRAQEPTRFTPSNQHPAYTPAEPITSIESPAAQQPPTNELTQVLKGMQATMQQMNETLNGKAPTYQHPHHQNRSTLPQHPDDEDYPRRGRSQTRQH